MKYNDPCGPCKASTANTPCTSCFIWLNKRIESLEKQVNMLKNKKATLKKEPNE